MNGIKQQPRQKQPRLRLSFGEYDALRTRVLERDGWRCQDCGSLKTLQVHHLKKRSDLGDDASDNLITLCVNCHRRRHKLPLDTRSASSSASKMATPTGSMFKSASLTGSLLRSSVVCTTATKLQCEAPMNYDRERMWLRSKVRQTRRLRENES